MDTFLNSSFLLKHIKKSYQQIDYFNFFDTKKVNIYLFLFLQFKIE